MKSRKFVFLNFGFAWKTTHKIVVIFTGNVPYIFYFANEQFNNVHRFQLQLFRKKKKILLRANRFTMWITVECQQSSWWQTMRARCNQRHKHVSQWPISTRVIYIVFSVTQRPCELTILLKCLEIGLIQNKKTILKTCHVKSRRID